MVHSFTQTRTQGTSPKSLSRTTRSYGSLALLTRARTTSTAVPNRSIWQRDLPATRRPSNPPRRRLDSTRRHSNSPSLSCNFLVTVHVENTRRPSSLTEAVECRPTSQDNSIELFKIGGEGAGIEEVLDRHADLESARSIYRTRVEEYPGRLIILLFWSDALAIQLGDGHGLVEFRQGPTGPVHPRSRSPGCPELSWLRLIASGQHPSVVTKQ